MWAEVTPITSLGAALRAVWNLRNTFSDTDGHKRLGPVVEVMDALVLSVVPPPVSVLPPVPVPVPL
jgi:hypothetical protein